MVGQQVTACCPTPAPPAAPPARRRRSSRCRWSYGRSNRPIPSGLGGTPGPGRPDAPCVHRQDVEAGHAGVVLGRSSPRRRIGRGCRATRAPHGESAAGQGFQRGPARCLGPENIALSQCEKLTFAAWHQSGFREGFFFDGGPASTSCKITSTMSPRSTSGANCRRFSRSDIHPPFGARRGNSRNTPSGPHSMV